jgi:hypothetical protein
MIAAVAMAVSSRSVVLNAGRLSRFTPQSWAPPVGQTSGRQPRGHLTGTTAGPCRWGSTPSSGSSSLDA